jgi:hypothetical protein
VLLWLPVPQQPHAVDMFRLDHRRTVLPTRPDNVGAGSREGAATGRVTGGKARLMNWALPAALPGPHVARTLGAFLCWSACPARRMVLL